MPRFIAPALLALALCGAPFAVAAESFGESQRSEIETIIKNYLLAHPEVLEEATNELTKRKADAEAKRH